MSNSRVMSHCPEEARVARTEKNVELLTKDVEILTKDVGRLVKAQSGLVKLHMAAAESMVEQKHTDETIKRLHLRLDEHDRKVTNLSDAVLELTTEKHTLSFLLKNWMLVLALLAAGYYGLHKIGSDMFADHSGGTHEVSE